MKKTRDLTFIAVLFVIICGLSPVFGQNNLADDCTAIYQILHDNHKSLDVAKLRIAHTAGNDYLKKCSDLQDQANLKTYVTGEIPKIEDRIKAAELKALEGRYEKAAKEKKYDEMLAAGQELLKLDRPYSLDLMLDLATAAYHNVSASTDKYNEAALTYAKQALDNLAAGKKSGSVDKATGQATYGVYASYKTAKCSDGKTNAEGAMNYIIGYITYNNMKHPDDALPYLYKASQVGCQTKDNPEIYRLTGDRYVDEFLQLEKSRDEKVKAANGEDTDETRAVYAMQKGYADRSLDAYARAYKAAQSGAYKNELLSKLKELYGFRYDGDLSKFDAYLANVGTTSFVDPTTPVAPVKDAVPPPAAETKTEAKTKTASKTKSTKAPSQKRRRKVH